MGLVPLGLVKTGFHPQIRKAENIFHSGIRKLLNYRLQCAITVLVTHI